MLNLYSRAQSFSCNTRTLSPLLGGTLNAASYLVRSKGKGNFLYEGCYRGIPFKFRRDDLSAIREIFFKQEYRELQKHLVGGSDRPFILDVGAHIGLFATWVYSLKPGAEVLSVEASPSTYKILAANAAKKNLSWTAINCAAWGSNGSIKFADESSSTMSHRVSEDGSIEIPTVTLADLAQGREVDVLKIDIEGAEESFLTAPDADFGNIKSLLMELHPSYCNAERVMDVLQRNFKKIENIKYGTDSKPVLLCWK
ncbi:MAG: FkbM family methyltransferase [Alphaproteobacteria bacterium]